MIKTIVFDFDGVIVRNSEFGKDKSWENLFPLDLKWQVDATREKYGRGKGSRFDIIRDLAPSVGVKPEDVEEWVKTKAKEFGDFTSAFTINCGVTEGDRKALETLASRFPLYLNSATPEVVLPSVTEALQISSFFRGVYGQRNPNSKIENMERAQSDSKTSKEEILFVGDQDTDWQTAEKFGCQFVGIMNDWNKWKVGDRSFPLIPAVRDLPVFLDL